MTEVPLLWPRSTRSCSSLAGSYLEIQTGLSRDLLRGGKSSENYLCSEVLVIYFKGLCFWKVGGMIALSVGVL